MKWHKITSVIIAIILLCTCAGCKNDKTTSDTPSLQTQTNPFVEELKNSPMETLEIKVQHDPIITISYEIPKVLNEGTFYECDTNDEITEVKIRDRETRLTLFVICFSTTKDIKEIYKDKKFDVLCDCTECQCLIYEIGYVELGEDVNKFIERSTIWKDEYKKFKTSFKVRKE